jgi:hypothetical protein
VIANSERAESVSDPSQALTRGVRTAGGRIGGPHDVREQSQRRIVQFIPVKDRIETDLFTVVPRSQPGTS